MVKNPPANAGDTGDAVSIPGLGRCPRVGNGNPFQYSCLENFMDGEAWRSTVHGVTKSQMWLSAHIHSHWHIVSHNVNTQSLLQSSYWVGQDFVMSLSKNLMTGESRGLQSIRSQRVRHNWAWLTLSFSLSWLFTWSWFVLFSFHRYYSPTNFLTPFQHLLLRECKFNSWYQEWLEKASNETKIWGLDHPPPTVTS